MEIRFIYHKSSCECCEKIIPEVVPSNFLEMEREKIKDDIFVKKYNEPAIEGTNVYFVFFSKPAMSTDSFADYIHGLYSNQEKTICNAYLAFD